MSPNQKCTFFNIYRHKSPLMSHAQYIWSSFSKPLYGDVITSSWVLIQVMTVASDAKTDGFLAPSFTIIPTHGWKENVTLEKCLSREQIPIEECIEMYAVNQSELIHDVVFGFDSDRKSLLARGISFVEGLAPIANRAKYSNHT